MDGIVGGRKNFDPGGEVLSYLEVMDRLQEILDTKRREIAKIAHRAEMLRAGAVARNDFRSFKAAIDRGPDALGLIAEVKKASPSAGVIAENFDPVQIARTYESAGANAISVLTDEQYFQGSLAYLTLVRAAVEVPVLRKDFILEEVQIYEASCAGADAILLIVAALEQERLERLLAVATDLHLDVLVEVHTMEEMDRALDTNAQIIGINNRNLATFQVDLKTTEELSEEVPSDVILVSESGIKTREDTRRVLEAGCNAILVGETLMRADDVHGMVEELVGAGRYN
jgi:indole-3-glycerol phosphate synthase